MLVTGASGNVGLPLVKRLVKTENNIVAGVRKLESSEVFSSLLALSYRKFDFEDSRTFRPAFTEIDIVFLLRPPHISDTEKYFRPLIEAMVQSGVKKVVFLSVQGVESSSVIPHHKIEKLIVEAGLDYVFVRPAYFMQNLTGNLLRDIWEQQKISLPAGSAKFNWVDAEDIAAVTAEAICSFEKYQNQAFDVTGTENLGFERVAEILSEELARPIRYESRNPVLFYFDKRKQGVPQGLAIVMIVLHFLPRFQPEPKIASTIEKLLGKKPNDLRKFIQREKSRLLPD